MIAAQRHQLNTL